MVVRRALKTLRAMLPWVLVSVAAAEVGLVVVRAVVSADRLFAHEDVAGSYMQTLGTVYAVLLAFVVFVVWTQFNEARAHVEREANELVDMFRTARGLPGEQCRKLHALLGRYVWTVLDREWDAMARGDEAVLEEGSHIIDELWRVLHGFEPTTECAKSLYAELLARLNELSDTRTNRLSSSRMKIPLALRILLYTGAVLVVGSMYLFAVERFWAHAIMTAALAGAIGHVLYLIRDLDDCFDGDWQVPRGPFERLRRYFQGCASVREAA